MKIIFKLSFVFLFLTLTTGCYKIKDKETIKGNITCVDTVNNKGVSGIKFIIYEEKKSYENRKIFQELETDQNGYANFEFKRPKNKKKWGYFLGLDIQSIPDSLEYYMPDLFLKYGASFTTSNDLMPLYNVYNEYDNNDVNIQFYPK